MTYTIVLFQSTLPRGERRRREAYGYYIQAFQSTLPRGERRVTVANDLKFITAFQSTLPRGERHHGTSMPFALRRISIHAPARGATSYLDYSAGCASDFNPRSREGSDVFRSVFAILIAISIHAPARGATLLFRKAVCTFLISIHAPARGATENEIAENANSEISIHAPARGATCRKWLITINNPISIHAPARGATTLCINGDKVVLHFNPRSREGSDNALIVLIASCNYFNPRSREGSDLWLCHFIVQKAISIHAPARGATSR